MGFLRHPEVPEVQKLHAFGQLMSRPGARRHLAEAMADVQCVISLREKLYLQ